MQVDDEMLEYMDIKRQIMEKPGNIDNNDEKSIEMNEFLAHSKNRKSNTETCINAIITCYPISKEETLKEYSEQISVYNKYALKNGMPICPTHNRLAMSPRQLPEEKMPDDK